MRRTIRWQGVAAALSAVWLLASIAAVNGPRPVFAQAEGGDEVAVQIMGYWGGTSGTDKQVIGTLQLVNDKGKASRSFGVTYARSYDPVTVGMDVFHQAEILPAHLVYGRDKDTDALFGAPDGKKITIIGVYASNSGELVVGSVKFPAEAKTDKGDAGGKPAH